MISMGKACFGSLLALGLFSATPQAYASQLTDAFVANASPNVDFLDKSSRLAVDRSSSRAVKSYARDVASRETIVANSFVAWWQANTTAGADAALGTKAAEPSADTLAPFGKVAGDVTRDFVDGSLLMGRSIAVDSEPTPAARHPLLPSQEQDYQKLETLHGQRFDAFYKITQRNALRQLAALYRDYASHGDDPALRSIAILQLDKSNELIVRLNALR